MRVHRRLGILFYIFCDYICSAVAWSILFFYRKHTIEGIDDFTISQLLDFPRYIQGLIFIPIGWSLMHFLSGAYSDIYRKSRLAEFSRTVIITVIGTLVLFFLIILDDFVNSYPDYYSTTMVLFGSQFLLTITSRMLLLTRAKKQIVRGRIGYNTIIIGGNQNAMDLYSDITDRKKSLGYKILGFVRANGNTQTELSEHLSCLGKLEELERILDERKIDVVILAVETSEHDKLNKIINKLANYKVIVKIIPDIYDIIAGSVKMNHVWGAILIEIKPQLIPLWQSVIKRAIDIGVSFLVLLLGAPIYIFCAIRVKMSSKGPILYSQQRVGKGGKEFSIYKFRSMFVNSEPKGPALSSDNDSRITKWGKFMRKWRFDELPQFFNVLIGDMSLVGPRPERHYFIEKISEEAPAYKHLQKVKPGITSWGMVKFGYAENVPQMIRRMKYDLLYIENMSLAIDFKIMFYTALTLLQGKGK